MQQTLPILPTQRTMPQGTPIPQADRLPPAQRLNYGFYVSPPPAHHPSLDDLAGSSSSRDEPYGPSNQHNMTEDRSLYNDSYDPPSYPHVSEGRDYGLDYNNGDTPYGGQDQDYLCDPQHSQYHLEDTLGSGEIDGPTDNRPFDNKSSGYEPGYYPSRSPVDRYCVPLGGPPDSQPWSNNDNFDHQNDYESEGSVYSQDDPWDPFPVPRRRNGLSDHWSGED